MAWLPGLICWISVAAVIGGVHLQLENGRASLADFDPVAPLVAVTFAWVGSLVASRRPGNPTGWLLCSVGFVGLAFFGEQYAAYVLGADPRRLPAAAWMAWFAAWAWIPGVILCRTLLLLVFPDGRPPSRPWRPIAVGMALLTVAITVAGALAGGALPGSAVANPAGVGWVPRSAAALGTLVAVVVGGPLCLAGLLTRYRRADERVRSQLKWFLRAAVVMTLVPSLVVLVPLGVPDTAYRVLGLVSLLMLPGAVMVAIVRSGLFDLGIADVKRFVDRSVVNAAVLLVAGATYWVIFRYSSENRLIALIAVVAAAKPLQAAFASVLGRMQTASRERYALLDLARRLDATVAPDQVLPAIVTTVAEALDLPYVAVEVRDDRGEVIAAELLGEIRPDAALFDLVHRGEVVGRLAVVPDRARGRLRSRDRVLLEDLSGQLAVAAYALRQTAALERARRRLVTEREEERARLRRDHHDGVKPALSGVIFELDAILNMCAAPDAGSAVQRIRRQADSAKGKISWIRADLRRLIDNQGPRSLDEFGLVGAVRHHVSTFGLQPNPLVVTVDAMTDIRGLPTDIEVGAFLIICEAVENVRRHARARRCTISLWVDAHWLKLEVRDDGQGLARTARNGVGLSSMEARAEELNGDLGVESSPGTGTLVRARLPLPRDREPPR
ncbi:MAG: sensor histidine kinase [Acidimicrobiales bacterium]